MSSSAFLRAPPFPRPTSHRRGRTPPWTCQQHTLILVPDHFAPTTPPWYTNLHACLPDIHVNLLQMPNPYESNSKRWESVWLNVIREGTSSATGKVSLLGHGTGADACLRFLENNPVDSGVVLIAPTGDEYFAGERHGRPYHWDLIRHNVSAGLVLVASAALDREENRSLVEGLRPTLLHELPEGVGRYAEEHRAELAAKFFQCANALEIS